MDTCHLIIATDETVTIVSHTPGHAGHGQTAPDLRAGFALARQHGLSVSYTRTAAPATPLVVLA